MKKPNYITQNNSGELYWYIQKSLKLHKKQAKLVSKISEKKEKKKFQ